MANKKTCGMKAAMHIYLVFFLVAFALVFACTFYFFRVVYIQTPNGEMSTSAWPKQFTQAFSQYLWQESEGVVLSLEGQEKLRENNLWFLLLDTDGDVMLSYGKAPAQTQYAFPELLRIARGEQWVATETVFLGTYQNKADENFYLIGFPLSVATVTMYLNGDHFTSGRSILLPLLLGGFVLLALSSLAYGLWITRRMRKITEAVEDIAVRTFRPLREEGMWRDVTASLNQLDAEIRQGDDARALRDKRREEWVANITHDLKTPLSPIQGYAELLTEDQGALSPEEIHTYAQTIHKNAAHIGQLVDDLRLTYEIQSGRVPLRLAETNLARLVKETLIDILNTPEFEGRGIEYRCAGESIPARVDAALFRRALGNLLVNALVHNAPDTAITVTLDGTQDITLSVADTGAGMTEEAVTNLFERYYRGTNTGEKPEGTGLGMAIAKEVVGLHHGTMAVKSAPGQGTEIHISLPKNVI